MLWSQNMISQNERNAAIEARARPKPQSPPHIQQLQQQQQQQQQRQQQQQPSDGKRIKLVSHAPASAASSAAGTGGGRVSRFLSIFMPRPPSITLRARGGVLKPKKL
jgi:hypothetical protein